MTDHEILSQIEQIIREIVDNPNLKIDIGTTAKDVAGWDSLTHINILSALENDFRIHFSIAEMATFDNVGAILNVIKSKKK